MPPRRTGACIAGPARRDFPPLSEDAARVRVWRKAKEEAQSTQGALCHGTFMSTLCVPSSIIEFGARSPGWCGSPDDRDHSGWSCKATPGAIWPDAWCGSNIRRSGRVPWKGWPRNNGGSAAISPRRAGETCRRSLPRDGHAGNPARRRRRFGARGFTWNGSANEMGGW